MLSDGFDDDDYVEKPVKRYSPAVVNIAQSYDTPRPVISILLNYVISHTILPKSLGCKEEIVVFVDCTNTFDIANLHQVLLSQANSYAVSRASSISPREKHDEHERSHSRQNSNRAISQSIAGIDLAEETQEAYQQMNEVSDTTTGEEVEEEADSDIGSDFEPHDLSTLIETSLNHLHVITCGSTAEPPLLDALTGLPNYLFSSRHESGERMLDTLIIHGINHSYWQDRYATYLARLESPNTVHNASHSTFAKIMTMLKQLQARFECNLIYTSDPENVVRYRNQDAPIDIYRQSAHVNIELSDMARLVPQFPPTIALEGCLHSQERRQQSIEAAGFHVKITGGGLSLKERKELINFELQLDECEIVVRQDGGSGDAEALEIQTINAQSDDVLDAHLPEV